MVRKCVRNLTVVMVELLILIFLDVEANNLAPTLFSSSPPILLHYSSKLDQAKESKHECLTNEIEGCESSKTTWPFTDVKYSFCIFS